MNYDQFMGALCLWREGRGQSKVALTGVWYVIQNRAADAKKRWPQTIPGVILQHAQFSSFLQSDPNVTKFPLPGSTQDWRAWLDCLDVVTVPIGGDPTNGANHYESLPPDAHKPDWADPEKISARIGSFRFYKL